MYTHVYEAEEVEYGDAVRVKGGVSGPKGHAETTRQLESEVEARWSLQGL